MAPQIKTYLWQDNFDREKYHLGYTSKTGEHPKVSFLIATLFYDDLLAIADMSSDALNEIGSDPVEITLMFKVKPDLTAWEQARAEAEINLIGGKR